MKLFVIILMASATMFAQPADGDGPVFPPKLERFLGLEAGQAEAIVNANLQFKNDPARQGKAEDLRLKRRELSEAINSQSPDPGVVGTLTVDIEMLGRELRAMREAFQQEMLATIFGVSPDDEQPATIVKRLRNLERAKKLMPLYGQALRFKLVDSPNQKKQSRLEAPPAE